MGGFYKRMFDRGMLGTIGAKDALGGSLLTGDKIDELKEKVGEFVDKAGEQMGAALVNNANYISTNVSNAVSSVSKGGAAIGGAVSGAFSSGNASVADVANCNIN